MENWDLQAVVGGNSSNDHPIENPEFSFGPWSFQQDEDFMSFPEIFETNPKVLDELEQLYKPFYPDLNPFSTQTIITSSIPVPLHVDEPAEKRKKKPSFTVSQSDISASPNPRRFSRKNQQNRVVEHVTADDLPSDVWAWRKYGQKPIKGSPFPRSYYRCSSSKGCLARKQVERSCSDPRVFIITYTAEHCHGHPTRRSSLAGSTRSKPLTAAKSIEAHAEGETVKQERMKMEVELHGEEEGGKILSPDLLLSDDELIRRLEDFDEGFFVDQFPHFSREM
ncbi:hypothetical protein Gohar_021333 [Gossypium harknessii]|uniref:WRKY domain-containing protein n=2 Tax=Gossypium TaxID=3633 RepID=A0A7J8LII2_9ROSI|nr:hypothetical protein [Gossypium lobatum]MBA0818467.1 hypothetical protein [Gossypium harknessii]